MNNESKEKTNQVMKVFDSNDWLIYDRCNIFGHGEHGFGSIETYDAIPATGSFRVYSLANYARGEDNGLCPELHVLRDEYIKARNPNVRIITLPTSDMWIDFARLVYAPNVLIPSSGSSVSSCIPYTLKKSLFTIPSVLKFFIFYLDSGYYGRQ